MEESPFQSIVIRELNLLLEKLGISVLETRMRGGNPELQESFVLSVSVDKEDSRLLIGQHGLTLAALQYMLYAVIRKAVPQSPGFSIDINEYWVQKKAFLKKDAEETARKVIRTGGPARLRPMSSYERKMAHFIFSHYREVKAESVGKGEERRIVVSPAVPVAPRD